MTDTAPRDPIADWHAQFAPPPRVDGPAPVDMATRAETVEHFAGEDGVFRAPTAAEPHETPAPEHDA